MTLLLVSHPLRAQTSGDTLDWFGAPTDNAWTSTNPVWDDVSLATPKAVSISASETNTYGFVFNGTNTSYGPGTATPTTMNIDAALYTSGISFSPGFNATDTTTIGNADTTSPSILAHALNFASGAFINDLNSSGAVTFTPTVSGGNNVLYFDLNGTTTFNPSAGSSLVLAVSIGDGTSSGSFSQTGAGTVTLSGSLNNYSGTTTVTADTLVVTSTTGAGAVTVSNTGTVLAGTGVARNGTTINGGAILSPGPGGNAVGVLSVGGGGATAVGLTLNGVLRVDLVGGGTTAGVNNDQVNVAGNLVLNATSSQLVLGSVNPAGLVLNQTFYLVLNGSSLPIVGTFTGLGQGATVTDAAGDTYTISYTANGDGGTLGNDVALMVSKVVPEPSTWALLGLGALTLGAVAVRRRVAG